MDMLDQMMAWENGELDEDQEAAFFQELVNSGLAWQLQGMYGRRATDFDPDGEGDPLMDETVSWRQARELLTGESGDGLVGVNEAQQILDDLAHFPGTTQFYANEQGSGYLSYAGQKDGQPRYANVPRKTL